MMLLKALAGALFLCASSPVATAEVPKATHNPIPVAADVVGRAKFPKAHPNEIDAISTINKLVNQSIDGMSDQEHYGVGEMWVMFPADGKGDCEDYVLTKLGILANAGFPAVAYSRIRNVIIKRAGLPDEGHAILSLRLPDSGDILFLDNRFNELMTRKELEAAGYIFFDW